MKKIIYGFYKSPFGKMVIGKSEKGICYLGFMVDGYKGDGYSRMIEHLPDAEFLQDNNIICNIGNDIMDKWEQGYEYEIALDLRGTEFQKSVWIALLKVKKGQIKSYGDIANDIKKPKSARAVGSAVGSNPVSLIVPCHRIIQKSGAIGNYSWGIDIKRNILRAENIDI